MTIETDLAQLIEDVDDLVVACNALLARQDAVIAAPEQLTLDVREWAIQDEDVLVSVQAGGNGVDEYSAYHWAQKAAAVSTDVATAEAARDAAQTAEGNASGHATAAGNSATAAANSATAASDSETAAGNSETNAGNSETAAGNSATAAGNSATAAGNSETAAGNSATAASNSASTAAGHETAAGNHADYAEEWAIKAEDSLISVPAGGDGVNDYSALHWAAKAEASAAEAAQSAASVTSPIYFAGSWDATSGAPPNPPGGENPFYKITVAGTINTVQYDINDNIVWDGADWFKVDNTEAVTSVGGFQGAVTAANLMTAIQTQHGPGSGLNADLLDGAEGAHYLAWGNFTGVPATFPPSGHTHLESEITDLDKYTQAEVTAFLAGKADDAHTHAIGEVTNLTTELAARKQRWYADEPGNGTITQNDIYNEYVLESDGTSNQDIQLSGTFNKGDKIIIKKIRDGGVMGIDADVGNGMGFRLPNGATDTALEFDRIGSAVLYCYNNSNDFSFNGGP